jgi:hypothetical protein
MFACSSIPQANRSFILLDNQLYDIFPLLACLVVERAQQIDNSLLVGKDGSIV